MLDRELFKVDLIIEQKVRAVIVLFKVKKPLVKVLGVLRNIV
jgi:hypothetical protein